MDYQENDQSGNDLHYRFTAYVNTALSHVRSKYLKHQDLDRQLQVSLDEITEAGADLSSSVDYDAAAFLHIKDFEQLIENDALCLAILELTGKERQILSLHITYKVPISEIAELMGVNYNTVYARYARAIKKIAEKLRNQNE